MKIFNLFVVFFCVTITGFAQAVFFLKIDERWSPIPVNPIAFPKRSIGRALNISQIRGDGSVDILQVVEWDYFLGMYQRYILVVKIPRPTIRDKIWGAISGKRLDRDDLKRGVIYSVVHSWTGDDK